MNSRIRTGLYLLDAMTTSELLTFHKEVSRRASAIYKTTYRDKQRAGYETAMAMRDTRFVKGLSARENIARNREPA